MLLNTSASRIRWSGRPVSGRAVVGGLLLGLGLLGGCGGSASSDEPATENSRPDPAKNAAAAAPAAEAPLRVNVFLELSGGMKGFMPANTAARQPTAFQNRVSALASQTNRSPAIAEARFLLGLKATPLAVSYPQFRNVLQGDTRQAALGTELPTMLENILLAPEADRKVSVVVSDFIYGPEKKEDFALMTTRITDALALVSKKQLAVAVLGETSRFYGNFYPAVKHSPRGLPLDGQALPYYIWLIGPPAAVARYLREVLPAPGPAVQQAYFGLSFPQVPYAAVLTGLPAGSQLAPGGAASVSYTTAQASPELDIEGVKKTAEFTVALNLEQLPTAWQQPALLAQQLQVSLPGGAAPRLVPGSVRTLTAAERAASTALAPYTHVLRLRLNALPKGSSTLSLTLAAPEVPAWVSQWGTQNDNPPGPVPHTFRLTEIMAGLRAAFPAALPPVFTAQLRLSNQD